MLKGRLGLETSRIPHVDRNGLLWLVRGLLSVQDGTLRFVAAVSPEFDAGEYGIPYQNISLILLGPGTSVTHDVFRLLARHGTGLAAIGEDGVRMYTAPPLGPDDSALARRQAKLWADAAGRLRTVHRMYEWRMGERPTPTDLNSLRGIEGARVKEMYAILARQHGIEWRGRHYDRANPNAADPANQAINHAATAVEAAASIAVAAMAAIPQLGFIHEDSANAFTLDVADLFREQVTIPAAFEAVRRVRETPAVPSERWVRRLVGDRLRRQGIIGKMIERIKELLDADDGGGHA
jgi:CRISPR-associated protein Cas1